MCLGWGGRPQLSRQTLKHEQLANEAEGCWGPYLNDVCTEGGVSPSLYVIEGCCVTADQSQKQTRLMSQEGRESNGEKSSEFCGHPLWMFHEHVDFHLIGLIGSFPISPMKAIRKSMNEIPL